MDRETFNGLKIQEQVEVFNGMLRDSSIRRVCADIGIGKTTIRKRFMKGGYFYSHDENQYILGKEIKSNNDITTGKDKGNIYITYKMYQDLIELIELKDKIREIINNVEKTDTVKIHGFKGDLRVKSIKVYDEVMDLFDDFMKNHRELKQQDVINQALWEFLLRYRR